MLSALMTNVHCKLPRRRNTSIKSKYPKESDIGRAASLSPSCCCFFVREVQTCARDGSSGKKCIIFTIGIQSQIDRVEVHTFIAPDVNS